ncbi:MAG TPA: 16S rRNA (cytosine(967)-C(5))-methyltransferase RsmB [Candidatus Acidoferrales bacterium]|nr:16S rRNA (cytosine(967)-C(5))-methyltransferase RsmB [Candidatus Acidoferrales bacterium]
MPVSSARKFAFEILLRVEEEAAYASDLLHARLDERVSARDAALATELVMGALRRQRELDFFIEQYTGRPAAALDAEVLIAIRIGIYQLRHLSRIPAHAAVSESVELVKRSRKKSAATLVNAVLRRATSEKSRPVEQFLHVAVSPIERMSIIHSHPAWLIERWIARFGESKTLALLESDNAPPSSSCALCDPNLHDQIVRSLEAGGIKTEPGQLSKNSLIITAGNAQKTISFQDGSLSFQDEASQLIPLLLDVRRGDSVLDLCAAPGGKTLPLSRAAGPSSLVVAADLYEHRLRAMRERFARTHDLNVALIALDATRSLPFRTEFDRILLDAPCSGTGTLSRNPEIRWRLNPVDLLDLHRRQVLLLSSALACLAPRGRLIYSTCSLEPEENEQVLSEVLSAHPAFRRAPVQLPADALAAGVSPSQVIGPDGLFRTFPPDHHTDGFFAAAIERI